MNLNMKIKEYKILEQQDQKSIIQVEQTIFENIIKMKKKIKSIKWKIKSIKS